MSDNLQKLFGGKDIAWDLTDLYASVDDPVIDKDLAKAEQQAQTITTEYKGRVIDLDAEELRDMVEKLENVYETAFNTIIYANLNWSINMQDPARGALLQRLQERLSKLQQSLVWAELEWANVPEEKAQPLIDDPVLAKYRHYLIVERLSQPYLLSEPEEKILSEKNITGRAAWSRFFQETNAATRYEWDGQKLPLEAVINKAYYSPDREVRQKATDAITAGLKDNARAMTYILNTLLADKASTDNLRGYKTWVSSRNLSNQVDDETVDALIEAVTSRYDIVVRYYKLKAKLLGVDELFDYDRYAPLPAADTEYNWEEAKAVVLKAFRKFSPTMAEIAGYFFDRNWIDAPVRDGKQSGAYSSGGVPSKHPYILLNFEGRARDVSTLAHELGHGIHQYLSNERGLLGSNTPLTTAEMASTFAEMLVFDDLMSQEDDPAVRLAMLTGKLEDSFATIFRQVAMNRFEHAIHTARREGGELTTEQFNEAWLETQRDEFKDSVTLREDYGFWWLYVYHFFAVPGYVYAYAFGELLVLALYARFREVGGDFADKYLDVLRAGGSDWPHEIVAPLGVDLTDPKFWDQGLQILDDMVSQAEALAADQAG